MKTENIVLTVIVAIVVALIICKIIKKEEYQDITACIRGCSTSRNPTSCVSGCNSMYPASTSSSRTGQVSQKIVTCCGAMQRSGRRDCTTRIGSCRTGETQM